MYTMTVIATLESDDGVMCEQTTTWRAMDRENVLALEGSFLDWQASLPRTIGAAPVVVKSK